MTTSFCIRLRCGCDRRDCGRPISPLKSSLRSRKLRATKQHLSGIPQSAWSRGISLIECQDNQTLMEGLQKLWAQRPQGAGYGKPFYVGIALGKLVPDHLHTLSLFSNLESETRRARMATTMDSMNHKYGTHTVMVASMLLGRAAAPTRIAFGSIPDLF